VRNDKQKTVGKKERACQNRRQKGKNAIREEVRTSEEGTNSFRKSSKTGRSPSRSEEGNKSKEMDKEMKTMIREIREDRTGIGEENKVLRKELAAVIEEMRGREKKTNKQREKKGRKNNVIIAGIGE
jgi:hypothetical protein